MKSEKLLEEFAPQVAPLRVQVADFLRDSILNGSLKPGQRVVERNLAKSLRVGQATVREALQVLENEGLIFKKANTASFVTQLSVERVSEIVEIRYELEPKAFVLAHRRRTPEDLKQLQSLVDKIEEAVAADDYYRVSRADLNFHQKVWDIGGNQTLERILWQFCVPLFAYLIVLLSTSKSPLKERLNSHQVLLDALAGTDEDKVREAAREHIRNSWYHSLPSDKEADWPVAPFPSSLMG